MKNYMDCFKRNIFAFSGDKNIILEKHLGICSNIASMMTPYTAETEIVCFQGCLYTNSAFTCEVRIGGELVGCREWIWLPHAIWRSGSTEHFDVESVHVFLPLGLFRRVKIAPHL